MKAFVAVYCIPKHKWLLTAGVFNIAIYTMLYLLGCWGLLELINAES